MKTKQAVRNMKRLIRYDKQVDKPKWERSGRPFKRPRAHMSYSIRHARYIDHLRAQPHHKADEGATDDMWALVEGLKIASRRHLCAQRLLSEYTYIQLGHPLYMKCRRILSPPKDPIRARVVPKGKPGKMNERERLDYQMVSIVTRCHEIIDGSIPV